MYGLENLFLKKKRFFFSFELITKSFAQTNQIYRRWFATAKVSVQRTRTTTAAKHWQRKRAEFTANNSIYIQRATGLESGGHCLQEIPEKGPENCKSSFGISQSAVRNGNESWQKKFEALKGDTISDKGQRDKFRTKSVNSR